MKKQTKYEKIINLYKNGMKQSEIIKKLKCGKSTVYNAVRKFRKAEEKKQKFKIYQTDLKESAFKVGDIISVGLPPRYLGVPKRTWKQYFMGLFK